MDQRLEVLRKVEVVDRYGSRATVWEPAGTIWAELVRETGRRSEEAQEHFPDYSAMFNVRAAHHIENNWRVRHIGGNLYTVTNIIPNRHRGMMTLQCERVNE